MHPKQRVAQFREIPLRPGRPGAPAGGELIIIGGHEDRHGEKTILREVADRLDDKAKIVVNTVASAEPESLWKEYEAAFRAVGVPHVYHLHASTREEASEPRALRILEGASAV